MQYIAHSWQFPQLKEWTGMFLVQLKNPEGWLVKWRGTTQARSYPAGSHVPQRSVPNARLTSFRLVMVFMGVFTNAISKGAQSERPSPGADEVIQCPCRSGIPGSGFKSSLFLPLGVFFFFLFLRCRLACVAPRHVPDAAVL
ncbi:hypothetical protein SKAU_G00029850 [Synaphobranchus kaupii]|uniref:Uncharacterized protein n=1 Tax=Synaphobranchus kaupii TaxID=118154 RepID=A0A9Q1GE26_SYNKA|nr:hypothetical protein SKAU_G00029850 [Synaphobranchus kaupii]